MTTHLLQTWTHRILAALRPVDAVDGAPIRTGIVVAASDPRRLDLRATRRGLFAVFGAAGVVDAQGLGYQHSDAQPNDLPLGSLRFRVEARDAQQRFLPRSFEIALPRDPDPGRVDGPDSLFQPVDLPMFPAARRVPGPSHAILRLTVRDAVEDRPAAHAVVGVEGGFGAVGLAGQADARGEILLLRAGLARVVAAPGRGDRLETTPLDLLVLRDPTPSPDSDRGVLPAIDPDDVLRRHREARAGIGDPEPVPRVGRVQVALAPGMQSEATVLVT